MGVKWKEGAELWLAPREYENSTTPVPVVVREQPIDPYISHVLVYHPQYNHDVYVDAERLYCSRKNAERAAHFLAALGDLKSEDEMGYILQGIDELRDLNKDQGIVGVSDEERARVEELWSLPPTVKKFHPNMFPTQTREAWTDIYDHRGHYLDSTKEAPTIYWDKRDAEAQLKERQTLLHLIVTSVSPTKPQY